MKVYDDDDDGIKFTCILQRTVCILQDLLAFLNESFFMHTCLSEDCKGWLSIHADCFSSYSVLVHLQLFNLGQRTVIIMVMPVKKRQNSNFTVFIVSKDHWGINHHRTLHINLLKFDLSSMQTNWNLMKSHLANATLYLYTSRSRKKVKEQILQETRKGDWYLHPGKHVMSI